MNNSYSNVGNLINQQTQWRTTRNKKEEERRKEEKEKKSLSTKIWYFNGTWYFGTSGAREKSKSKTEVEEGWF